MFSRVLDQTTKSSRQTSRPSPTVARLKSRRGRAMLEVRDVPAAYYCNPVWSPVSMATTINVGAEFAITGSTAFTGWTVLETGSFTDTTKPKVPAKWAADFDGVNLVLTYTG